MKSLKKAIVSLISFIVRIIELNKIVVPHFLIF
jgi:hypothetical protein